VGRFIANHLGVKLDLVRLDWKGILPGAADRPLRRRLLQRHPHHTGTEGDVRLLDPYSRSAVVVVVAKGNVTDINGPSDLKGRMVGATSGGMDGEIPAKAIEKEHGAFKSFKG